MNKNLSKLLMKCGIRADLLGFEYIGMAVEIVAADRNIIHAITKELYPSIARKFNSYPSRVERAIRHAIEVAFYNMTPDMIYEIFGNTISYSTGKPTNSQFIASVAEIYRQEKENG